MSQLFKHLWVDLHIEITSLSPNSYMKNILRSARLLDFVTVKPKHLLPKAVFEFSINMNKDTATTAIIDPLITELMQIDLNDLSSTIFKLNGDSTKPESAGVNDFQSEFCRFSTDPNVVWRTGMWPIRDIVRPPFNHLAEIITKTLLCHWGGHNAVTEHKICTVSIICDSAGGAMYDWRNFFVHQIIEGAMMLNKLKTQKFTNSPTNKFLMFGGRISNALETLFPNMTMSVDGRHTSGLPCITSPLMWTSSTSKSQLP